MRNTELEMLHIIYQDPTSSLGDVLDLWRDKTGRVDGESTLQMLEAKGLVLVDEASDSVMLSRKGGSEVEKALL